jgi:L-threonylcarbamoyladenylate synthase
VALWRWQDGELGTLRELLGRGGLLAIPTESSYGIAVDPRSERGVASVYAVKSRDAGKPLPVVVADLAQAEALGVDVEHPLVRRAQRFWPAPLTVVAPLRGGSSLPAAAGRADLAVRIPAHEPLLHLLRRLGHALTATSANRSGEPPLLDPGEVAEWLGGHDAVVVDGGVLPGGAPSTMVSWRAGEPVVLRRGAFDPSLLDPGGRA